MRISLTTCSAVYCNSYFNTQKHVMVTLIIYSHLDCETSHIEVNMFNIKLLNCHLNDEVSNVIF